MKSTLIRIMQADKERLESKRASAVLKVREMSKVEDEVVMVSSNNV